MILVAESDANMSLVEFCKYGDLEGVKAALQSGADVNTKGVLNSMTGLMWAVSLPVRKNSIPVVELLLDRPNIDVNLKCVHGRSALFAAVKSKNIEALKLLLKVPNIDVNIVDNVGNSAVHVAVFEKNIEALKLLLNVPNIDVNTVNNDGWSALHAAVYSHNDEGLKLLLSHPSLTALTLNQKERERKGCGATPVMFAVMERNLTGLFSLGADPRVDLDTTDKKGRSLEEVAR